VRIWDPATGTATLVLTGTLQALTAGDGNWLVAAGHDKTARIWNLFPAPGSKAALRVDGALTALAVMNGDALVAAVITVPIGFASAVSPDTRLARQPADRLLDRIVA
jgi:hypothetical protein